MKSSSAVYIWRAFDGIPFFHAAKSGADKLKAHHIKFASDVNLEPGHIHVEVTAGNTSESHIGLLVVHHTYEADIPIKHDVGPDVVAVHPQHNFYVTCVEASPTERTEDGLFLTTVKVRVKTIKEGSISEKIDIVSETDDSKWVKISVTAKVLAKGQGTPLLKDGVKMISHEYQDESDFSDWQGDSR